jgi:hypothetical protein
MIVAMHQVPGIGAHACANQTVPYGTKAIRPSKGLALS